MDSYIALNSEVNLLDENGNLQLGKDREAARAYFLEHVNPNTVFFHSLDEKTKYMVDNQFWDKETVETFPFGDFKELFKRAYAHKFRFQSFMGARKFYTQYAIKNTDGDRYLERYEDRVVMCAIDLSGGDYDLAGDLVDVIIGGYFQPATPTFLNAGRAQGGERVSCFLLRTDDNMESIGRMVNSALQLSKRGGGVGISLTNLREAGAQIKGIKGASSGLVPVMKVLEDSFSYANQLGQRQGAGAVYVNAHHPDIMAVLDTKRENADEKIRIKTLSLGIVVPDITFTLAKENRDMYLFSPFDVEKVMGKPLTDLSVTAHYNEWVEDDRIAKKKINARVFFQTISELQFESGYPYILFEDTANRHHTMKHAGRISMSNLCVTGDTELLTDKGYRKAKGLYDSQEDFKVVVDERARTMDLNNKGTSIQLSSRMFKTAEDAEIWKLTTHEGHEIKATEWHKFYVERAGELVKIPLNEVEEGDRLLVHGGETLERGNMHYPDLAYIAGVMAADGTYTTKGANPSARIDLYGDKQQFSDKVKSAVHRALDGRNDLCERQATTTPEWNIRRMGNPKLHMNSTPLAKLLDSYGVSPETKVSVPEFVKRGDRDTQKAFIDGVWAMDGCITGSKGTGSISLELGSIHLDFLRDMQKLLLCFGAYTRIYPSKKVGALTMLPDGNGGLKQYYQSQSWTLRVTDRYSREVLHGLVEWRGEAESYWQDRVSEIKTDSYYSTHKYMATVKEIEFYGVEDVYDPTVDNGHSVIYNGIVTGNCSEIAQLQTPSVFNDDLSYIEVGADISCNLGSLNVKRMLDCEDNAEFGDIVSVAVRALDTVARTTEIDSVPSVREGNNRSRSIGLGQMNLHGALAHYGLEYGSPEALKLWDNYMALVTYHATLTSSLIAQEDGHPHAYWEGSTYTTGEWWENTVDEWLKTHDDLTIIGNLHAPDREEWDHIESQLSQHGMAHAYLQTIPPTGSISYINHSTSSIHPVAAAIETRKEGKLGRVYYPAPHLTPDNVELFKDAYNIGPEKIIDTYAISQHWVDQSQSLTLFFKDTATTRDLDRARIYAWRNGIKTLYYIRLRQKALDGTGIETASNYCESCAL